MKSNILFATLGLIFFSVPLLAQNVGIGTLSPSSTLEIVKDSQTTYLLEEDFEDLSFLPMTSFGDAEWAFTPLTLNGDFGIGSPELEASQTAVLRINIEVPENRIAEVNFQQYGAWQTILSLEFRINDQLSISPISNGGWQNYNLELTAGSYVLDWVLENLGSILVNEDERRLDDVTIKLKSTALRIEDGTEGAGKYLVSDYSGAAEWSHVTNLSDKDADTKLEVDDGNDLDKFKFKFNDHSLLSIHQEFGKLIIAPKDSSLYLGKRNFARGTHNYAIGHHAGSNVTPFSEENIFIGSYAGFNATSSNNIFMGHKAGYADTDGHDNLYIGNYAGYRSIKGHSNIFLGGSSGEYDTAGIYNTYLGIYAGNENRNGTHNSFVGAYSGLHNLSNHNTFQGAYSGAFNSTGLENTFIGFWAARNNDIGSWNTMLGAYAGQNSNGSENTFVGYKAGLESSQGTRNVIIGAHAGEFQNGNDNTIMGYRAGISNTEGIGNVFIGAGAGRFNSLADYNIFIGFQAGYSNGAGINNTFLGRQAGFSNTSSNNTFLGNLAGNKNLNSPSNTFIGNESGKNNTIGTRNTFVGDEAGALSISGDDNTFVGFHSGKFNSSGYRNIYLGNFSGRDNTTGYRNTSIGYFAGKNNETGYGNVAIGDNANPLSIASILCTFVGNGAQPLVGNAVNTTGVGNNAKPFSNNAIRFGDASIIHISAYSGWIDLSDGKFKNSITKKVPGLDFILGLNPVSYKIDYHKVSKFLKEDVEIDEGGKETTVSPHPIIVAAREEKSNTIRSGFIAQEVDQLVKEMDVNFPAVYVPKNENDHYGIEYAQFVVPLVKAVQDQQKIIDQLLDRIEKLEQK